MDEMKQPAWAKWFVDNTAKVAMWTIGVWIVFGFVAPLLLSIIVPPTNIAVSGQIGDMFGVVNSLFSGFAFIAAITAVMLQTIEMREAGGRQLEENRLQTKQMEIAERTTRIQEEMIANAKQVRVDAYVTNVLDGLARTKYHFNMLRTKYEILRKSGNDNGGQLAIDEIQSLIDLRIKFDSLWLLAGVMFGKEAGLLAVYLSKWPEFIMTHLRGFPLDKLVEVGTEAEFNVSFDKLFGPTLTEIGNLSPSLAKMRAENAAKETPVP